MLLLPFAGEVTGITEVYATVYTDNSGSGPGVEVGISELYEVSNTLNPDTFAGFEMWDIEFNFVEPILLSNNDTTEARYWVALSALSATDNQILWVGYVWDPTSSSEYSYQTSSVGETWTPVIENVYFPGEFFESQWTISGECNALGVDDNMLSQVSVYPNPTSNVLNLQTPANVEINSVGLYDILGKQVNARLNNGTINVSALSQGVYLLKVVTSAGTLTKKIVKQ